MMKYKKCSNCGHENPMENAYCSKCGTVFKNMIPHLKNPNNTNGNNSANRNSNADWNDSANGNCNSDWNSGANGNAYNSYDNKSNNRRLYMYIAVGCAVVLLCALALLAGMIHRHTWLDATCTAPQTCEECGETKGVAMGHQWSDATCTSPSICQRCDATGLPMEHDWIPATYQFPQICADCGQEQGQSLSGPWMREPPETSTGIIAVSAGGWTLYALTNQGKVYANGVNKVGQANVGHWSNVVDIAAGDRFVVALFSDNTVDAIGHYEYGQCDVHHWTDIKDIAAGVYCTVGIRQDGKVELAGRSPDQYGVTFDVSDWTDIVQVSISDQFIVGLRTDGTVVYTGGNGHEGMDNYYQYNKNGNADEIAQWRDITSVATGFYHTIGLRADGTVVATTPKAGEYPEACNVEDWENIVAIAAGASFSVGLRSDGRVVVAGDFCDQDIISNWKGSINTVKSWRNIIQISVVYNQIIGLTKDGYIVACGFNPNDMCNVDTFHDKIFGVSR